MNYYIDPNTTDLIIYDPDENEIRVLKPIEEAEYIDEEVKEKKPEKEIKPKKGKKGKVHKIDDQTIEEIRSMARDGKSKKEISLALGVSYMTVHKYLKGDGFKPFSGEESQKENEVG